MGLLLFTSELSSLTSKILPPPEQLRQQVRSAELLALEFYRKNHNIRETSTSGEASASAVASDEDDDS